MFVHLHLKAMISFKIPCRFNLTAVLDNLINDPLISQNNHFPRRDAFGGSRRNEISAIFDESGTKKRPKFNIVRDPTSVTETRSYIFGR